MKDEFDRMMEKYSVPMSEFKGPVMDSTYFLRKDGSFVFTEGYCHPPGHLWGMIIKYPLPGGHINVFGRPYSWTHRQYVDGKLVMVPFHQQVENQFKVAPELRAIQGEKPPYARNFVKFPLSDFRGYFDSQRSMSLLRGEHEWIDSAVRKTCELLQTDPDATGVTGSLAYGRVEDDIDIVFIGSPEDNARIAAGIRNYLSGHTDARVFELGKEWPLRFYFAGTLICPFFRYAEPDQAPLSECRMEVRERGVQLEGKVSEDRHNLYLPAVLRLTDIRLASGRPGAGMELIVYHGAMRGEIWRGERLRLRADLVRVTTPGEGSRRAILITDMAQLKKL